MIAVKLTSSELFYAAMEGVRRHVHAVQNNARQTYGRGGTHHDWNNGIVGMVGELCVAKAFGLYWTGLGAMGQFQLPDVGPLQVRTTVYDTGCLLLHPEDGDDDTFVLVTGDKLDYALRGWCYARDGKRDEFWRRETDRPAFFVPQSALQPIETLKTRAVTDRDIPFASNGRF